MITSLVLVNSRPWFLYCLEATASWSSARRGFQLYTTRPIEQMSFVKKATVKDYVSTDLIDLIHGFKTGLWCPFCPVTTATWSCDRLGS